MKMTTKMTTKLTTTMVTTITTTMLTKLVTTMVTKMTTTIKTTMMTKLMTKLVTKTMTAGDLPVAQRAQSTNEQLRPTGIQVRPNDVVVGASGDCDAVVIIFIIATRVNDVDHIIIIG